MSEEKKLSLRYMDGDDIDAVVECERQAHSYTDPDFDVPQVRAYALGKEAILDLVRQHKSKTKGTNDTRVYVAEWDGVVCGTLVYELQPEGYEILLFSVHPQAPEETRAKMLAKVRKSAEDSEKRKKISAVIQDGDWANIKFFQDSKFDVKYVRSREEGQNDTWRCERTVGKGKVAA